MSAFRFTAMIIAAAFAFAGVLNSAAVAQLDQLNSGTSGVSSSSASSANSNRSRTSGSTTDGTGGVTTQGPGNSTAQDGGLSGSNIIDYFIGGNASEEFVGGGLQTQNINRRQFRGITGMQVPQGGNRKSSGKPRRAPTSLRVAFRHPPADAITRLIGPMGPALGRATLIRPELRNVSVQVQSDGVATLTGTVPTADAIRLAGNLVRLRPGVRGVENRISVSIPQ